MMMAYAALDEMLLKLKYTRPIFNKPHIFLIFCFLVAYTADEVEYRWLEGNNN